MAVVVTFVLLFIQSIPVAVVKRLAVLWNASRFTERTCLCFGSLLHMTYNRPFRRTTAHPSQNFFTADRTFMPRANEVVLGVDDAGAARA